MYRRMSPASRVPRNTYILFHTVDASIEGVHCHIRMSRILNNGKTKKKYARVVFGIVTLVTAATQKIVDPTTKI